MSPSFFLFVILYLFSFLLCLNMDDWFLVWLGLEINMISFIFLIYSGDSVNNIESCLKYFFIQSLGSAFFIMFFYLNESELEILSVLVLSYKMGGGPFFFWFPSLCEGIPWLSCLFLMSFQKLMPLILMMSMMMWIVWVIVILSLVIGAVGSFNQVRMKMLMSFSSIHHVGWLLVCMYINMNAWMMYYLVYFIVMFLVIYKLGEYEVNNYLNVVGLKIKWWMLLLMMNMGGMPPFLGFFLKWMGFYYILNSDLFMMIYMIFMSIVMFYVYIRICYGILMDKSYKLSFMDTEMEVEFNNVMKVIFDVFIMLGMMVGGMFLGIFM